MGVGGGGRPGRLGAGVAGDAMESRGERKTSNSSEGDDIGVGIAGSMAGVAGINGVRAA